MLDHMRLAHKHLRRARNGAESSGSALRLFVDNYPVPLHATWFKQTPGRARGAGARASGRACTEVFLSGYGLS